MKSIYGSYYPVSVPYMINEIQTLKQERKQMLDLLENFCNNLSLNQPVEEAVDSYLDSINLVFSNNRLRLNNEGN
jgi:hypothetical protein